MTENEAIERLKKETDILNKAPVHVNKLKDVEIAVEARKIAISSLSEIQRYRALGTVEELREAMEKQRAKKPVCKSMPYSEEVGLNDEWLCLVCGAYVGYFSEGMSEPEQMDYCNECGQHIARDWSEEE